MGIEAEWRVLPADEARGIHARVIFDDTATPVRPGSALRGRRTTALC